MTNKQPNSTLEASGGDLLAIREQDRSIRIDPKECFAKGLVGFLGAIPATIAAHPCDALKIRMQVSGNTLSSVLRDVMKGGAIGGTVRPREAIKYAFVDLYRGLGPGIQQKMFTRGPMFFFSNFFTQVCEKVMNLDKTLATFLGSTISGYCTGFIAAPREWMKVLSNSNNLDASQKQRSSLILTAFKCGQLTPALKRMHSAGVRNAIFDSIFFGTQHLALESFDKRVSPAWAYALSATMALSLDYIVDVTVKRGMAIAPQNAAFCNGGVLRSCWSLICKVGPRVAYRGLSVKSVEFMISYFITGACSVVVYTKTTELLQLILE